MAKTRKAFLVVKKWGESYCLEKAVRFTFICWAFLYFKGNSMRVKLECSPLGNKIKFRFQGKLVCKRLGELTKSLTLDRTDWVVKLIFGSQRNADSFLKKNRKMYIVVDHTQLLLDPCDRII